MAPGKLVLTGAYAVLEGAPALVAAVDRYAIADTARSSPVPSPEVRAAFGADAAPEVDAAALQSPAGGKLGLGSSAATLVASLGARALDRGENLADPDVRGRLFRVAREAHARAQGGGSGADVAASVYGGVIRYTLRGRDAVADPVGWPAGLVLAAFFMGRSARTSDLLDRVDAARLRSPREFAELYGAMCAAAAAAAGAIQSGASELVECVRAYGGLLGTLGRLAEAPIVPPACAELGALAPEEGAVFVPSGAGGGDSAVWIGPSAPSDRFAARAEALGFWPFAVRIDRGGVRRASLDTRRS